LQLTLIHVLCADLHFSFEAFCSPALNGDRLFEREDAATFLAQCLLSGTPRTPVSDLMHGAGKTAFF
jgi:hypothetical protein